VIRDFPFRLYHSLFPNQKNCNLLRLNLDRCCERQRHSSVRLIGITKMFVESLDLVCRKFLVLTVFGFKQIPDHFVQL
jgi:hypothetical protein